jgi:signal transduction histidine kinase
MSETNGNSRLGNINNNNKIIAKLPTKTTTTIMIKIISFIVISIGTAIALFGWIFGYLEVTSIIKEGVTMKFVTAIFFILSGFTLYSLCNFIVRKSSIFYVAIFTSSFIEFIFLVTLFSSIVLGIPTGIENAFSHEPYSQYSIPGKPSYPTIINFFFIVLVSFIALYDNKRVGKYLYFGGLIIIIVSSIALIGYITNNHLLFYSIPPFTSAMAFPTAILFTLTGSGMILLSNIGSSNIQKSIIKSSSSTKLALITKEKDSIKKKEDKNNENQIYSSNSNNIYDYDDNDTNLENGYYHDEINLEKNKENEDKYKSELNTSFIESSPTDSSKIKTLKLKHILIIFFLVFSIFPIVYVQLLNYNNIISIVKDQQIELLLYRNLVNSIIIVTISTIISAIIFALILSKSIAFPLETLKAIARNFTQQQYHIPIKIPWQANLPYEVFDLFLQIDKMRKQIKSVNDNLNSLVKKKTNELQIANQDLLLQDKMQKEFINISAHELRTPIVPILTLSELLYDKIKNENEIQNTQSKENKKKQEEFLQVILRNAYRLYQLTQDILDVTKIESQILKMNKELIQLNEIIENIVNDYKDNIIRKKRNDSDKEVRIVYDEPIKEPIFVNADKARIIQVLSNLLGNALKFTKGGNISISFKKINENKEVIVTIKDSGTGIDPGIYPRLFTKFATKSEEGTGLGLYISKSIVEAHGGKIWAENNSDGRGATFYFTLPMGNSWNTNNYENGDY